MATEEPQSALEQLQSAAWVAISHLTIVEPESAAIRLLTEALARVDVEQEALAELPGEALLRFSGAIVAELTIYVATPPFMPEKHRAYAKLVQLKRLRHWIELRRKPNIKQDMSEYEAMVAGADPANPQHENLMQVWEGNIDALMMARPWIEDVPESWWLA